MTNKDDKTQINKDKRETNFQNFIASPRNEGGQIHLNPAVIRLAPTLNLDRQSEFSILKPTIILSSSTCFFHVLFDLPFFLIV